MVVNYCEKKVPFKRFSSRWPRPAKCSSRERFFISNYATHKIAPLRIMRLTRLHLFALCASQDCASSHYAPRKSQDCASSHYAPHKIAPLRIMRPRRLHLLLESTMGYLLRFHSLFFFLFK